MRDDNDVMVRNFGTGLWGVSNVSVRVSSFGGTINSVDIVDANDNSNVISISGATARAIADAVSDNNN